MFFGQRFSGKLICQNNIFLDRLADGNIARVPGMPLENDKSGAFFDVNTFHYFCNPNTGPF